MFRYLSIFLLCFGFLSNLAKAQHVFERETIRRATVEERGINIVFMGDAFAANEQDAFVEEVRRLSNGLFAEAPFREYANYFNVYALKVVSNDAVGYFQYGVSQSNLLTVNTNTVDAVRNANFPNNNRTVVVVLVNNEALTNSNILNPSANAVANRVLIKSTGRAKVLAHEMGHAFGRVTDEYWTTTGLSPNKAPFGTPPENLSWRRWIGAPDNNGTFVGRNRYDDNLANPGAEWIRPSQSCLMRFTEDARSFCPVCSQEIIKKVHELVSSVGTRTPSATNQVNVRNFSINNLITPDQNTLICDWYIGDEDAASMLGSAIEIPISKFGGPGTFNVKVVVYDATPSIRIDNGRVDGMEVYTFTWRVTITQQYYNQQQVLPIALKDFSAKAEPKGVKLTWNTLSEKGNDHFILEKSVDGKDFTLLTMVSGNRTTNDPKSYMVFDDKPFSGTSYYRLTQVDANGDKNIIDTKSVNFSLSSTEYAVYPMPAHGYFYWKGKQNSTEDIEFTLSDIIGGTIYRKIEKYSPDPIIIKPTIKPKTGLYILRVKQKNMQAQNIRVMFQ